MNPPSATPRLRLRERSHRWWMAYVGLAALIGAFLWSMRSVQTGPEMSDEEHRSLIMQEVLLRTEVKVVSGGWEPLKPPDTRLEEVEEKLAQETAVRKDHSRVYVFWFVVRAGLVVAILLLGLVILTSKNIRRVLRKDNRLPILYLRSFRDDSMRALKLGKSIYEPKASYSFAGGVVIRHEESLPESNSEESELVEALQQAGPVIAIGRPGEILPVSGATRFYVSDNEWQDAIGAIVPHCRAVVIHVGTTDGLNWELAHLREKIDPGRLFIYAPQSLGSSAFSGCRGAMESHLKVPLHSLATKPDEASFFLTFAPDWQPEIVAAAETEIARSPVINTTRLPPKFLELLRRSLQNQGDPSAARLWKPFDRTQQAAIFEAIVELFRLHLRHLAGRISQIPISDGEERAWQVTLEQLIG